MQVLEGSIKKKDPILNKNYVSTNNFYLRDYLSEVNRQSLRQILIAFLRENILESYYQDGNLTFKLPKLKCFIYISQVRLNSLLRFTEFEKVFLVNSEQNVTENITDPIKLLEIVKKELNITFDVEQWDKVSREVGNHIQNTVLINWQKDKIKNDLVKRDSNDFSNSFREHKKLSDCSFKFEQLAFNGHPYHPFAKTKVGFSIEDILSYTTEFRPKVFILLAAVRKDAMCIEMTQEKFVFSRWFSEYYPDAWDLWVYELNKRNLHHEDYIPFPLHPWQAINSVKNLFSDHISANEVILFDNVAIEMSPTSSFRTLAPVKNWYAPYIKLPIGIYASGVLRTLSVTSIKNTPKITHIMKNILAKENSISERLAILPEICGLYLNAVEDDKAKHFTAIFRENVTNYLANNEIAIVVSALFEKLSANDTSLFIELVQLAGCLSYKDTLNYFAKYVDLVLGSYLDIYLIYGIALEGHQQNTLAVFENGHIKRFIARDFDGIEIYADSLNSHNFNLNSPLSPPFVTHNKMTVRNQLLHTVYQLHLGELVLLLAAHFKGEEKDFWNIIREKTEERFFALEERVDTARWKDEYQAILKADWPVKALFRMRLEKQYVREGIFSYIENPLAI
ncbi:IucA/IucC family protein [Rickettsiella endosymbiont of Dermanyssus gallinae]|uniref:IucA/IucC family protein n=1 Tax=Rickettsiella endosymbiont of Dermanyssus gallinae TaxID=2856608 RepID=UPI001C52E94C|nr:IucA/IucC family protein [Rickettsiella endosymbiont of Dermanyssus gallinae]